ncbi:phospholipase A2 family protein [Microvirga sp. M2]|uniref:phospholipase A2 family protein n=1 Tax=Microvirga sp. M2 TaxID=3073270 RepID=UPI0039C16C70
MAAPSTAPVAQPAPSLFHGNWCGLGDMNRRKPIDALDAACRAHDLCYERRGRGACSCDRAFLKATAFLSQRRRIDDAAKAKAALANTLFTIAPCIETGKTPRRAGKR